MVANLHINAHMRTVLPVCRNIVLSYDKPKNGEVQSRLCNYFQQSSPFRNHHLTFRPSANHPSINIQNNATFGLTCEVLTCCLTRDIQLSIFNKFSAVLRNHSGYFTSESLLYGKYFFIRQFLVGVPLMRGSQTKAVSRRSPKLC